MDERTKAIRQQEAIIALLTKEGEKDDKDTVEAHKAAEEAARKFKETGVLRGLTISWTGPDGKKDKIVIDDGNPLSPGRLAEVMKNLPRAIAAAAGKSPAGESTATILNNYRRRSMERHTKLRNAMARIADLRAGGAL